MDNIEWDDAHLPYSARRNREVFARYGLAMHNAQCLEKQLCIMLALADPECLTMLPAERDDLFDICLSKTMGGAWSKLKEIAPFAEDLYQRIESAKLQRNYLAHNYFWVNAISLTIDSGQESMIRELTEMTETFKELDAELTSITEAYVAHFGITEDFILNNIKHLQIEWQQEHGICVCR